MTGEKAEAQLKIAWKLLSMLEYQHRESQDCGGEQLTHESTGRSICYPGFCDSHLIEVRKWLEDNDDRKST